MSALRYVQKRDGVMEPFDRKRITNAIWHSFQESRQGTRVLAAKITESIVESLLRAYPFYPPHVEDIQDLVEDALISYNFKEAAKEFIRYRYERNKSRLPV